MTKLKISQPIVELLGDEMAAIMWDALKEKLLFPFLDLNLKVYDLSIQNRDKTENKVTFECAEAIKEIGVGVKCATITATEARVKEFSLKQMWKSPNGTIRNILDGAIFRKPIIIGNVPRLVPSWKKPITIARHAFGDQYLAKDIKIPKAGKIILKYESDDKTESNEVLIAHVNGKAVAMGMFNTAESIESFARSCFHYGLSDEIPVYLSTKNTILQEYDGEFHDIFARIYEQEFEDKFTQKGIHYEHKLIDDMVAYALRAEGDFLWAAKNYDGDVQSDALAQGYGSLGLMTSVLFTPSGDTCLTEAAHGTVTAHYRAHQRGEKTSTNPIASIFAWTKAFHFIAEKNNISELEEFALKLENAVIQTVEDGIMTKDLALLISKEQKFYYMTDFLDAIAEKLKTTL